MNDNTINKHGISFLVTNNKKDVVDKDKMSLKGKREVESKYLSSPQKKAKNNNEIGSDKSINERTANNVNSLPLQENFKSNNSKKSQTISRYPVSGSTLPQVIWTHLILKDFSFSDLLNFRLVCKTYYQIADKAANFKCTECAKTAINLLFERGLVAGFECMERANKYAESFEFKNNQELIKFNEGFTLLRSIGQQFYLTDDLEKALSVVENSEFKEKIEKSCSSLSEKFEFKKTNVTDLYFTTLVQDFSTLSENSTTWFDLIEIIYLFLDNDSRKSSREKVIQNIKYILQQRKASEEQLSLLYTLLKMDHNHFWNVVYPYVLAFSTIIGKNGKNRTIVDAPKDEIVKIILFKKDEIIKAVDVNVGYSKYDEKQKEFLIKLFGSTKEMIDRTKAYLAIRSKTSKTMALLQPKIAEFEKELMEKYPEHYGKK